MMSIRQIRRMREIRQQEMADYLGIHVQTYRKIEEHPETATVEQAKKIAEKLKEILAEIARNFNEGELIVKIEYEGNFQARKTQNVEQ